MAGPREFEVRRAELADVPAINHLRINVRENRLSEFRLGSTTQFNAR